MKIFIAYRFTGENHDSLVEMMGAVTKSLEKAGHTNHNSLARDQYYKDNNYTANQIMEETFEDLKKSDIFLAIVKSSEKSEGMLIEMGYAKALGKKIILAIKEGVVSSSAIGVADEVLRFNKLDDLCSSLENI